MKILSNDDYNRRLDKHIKDAFKNELKLTHPCEHQKQNCLKGSECPLIGLPNDICIHHVRKGCKFSDGPTKCPYKHDNRYAEVYKRAKYDFKQQEATVLATSKRLYHRFLPIMIWLAGLIFSYFLRRTLDTALRKIY